VRCSRDEEEKAQRERGDEAKVGGCVKTALGRRGASQLALDADKAYQIHRGGRIAPQAFATSQEATKDLTEKCAVHATRKKRHSESEATRRRSAAASRRPWVVNKV
jgi:hypothetical protein